MSKKKLVYLAFFLIILLGAAIRLYKLGEAPKGLYIDEAGQGYSAYSILKTGKDEFGKSYPIVFRSFTDFKTPIYIYLIVPLIPLFDLNAFTVRFPSFLLSVLTLPVIYLLVKNLSREYKYRVPLALFSTLLLAISPWHILFGRADFECNVALFFYLLAVLMFYEGLKNRWLLIVSAVIFAIAFSAYHSERILTPVTILFLFIRYKTVLLTKTHLGFLILGGFIAFLITIPTLMIATTPGFLARASGLNIFSQQSHLPSGYMTNYHDSLSFVINSPLYLSSKEFLSLYVSYFSPRNMFYLGDYELRTSFPDLATFFVWEFPFYILGIYFLLRKKELGELKVFTILLLLISPIPAAVTRDPYTTIRALPLVVPQTVLIGIGLIGFFEKLKEYKYFNYKLQIFTNILVCLLVIHSVLNLYSSSIILNEFYRAPEWGYGLEEVAHFLQDKYQRIPAVIDNSRHEHYIQLAFFLKHDPEEFQKQNYEVPLSEYYTNMTRNSQKHIGQIITRQINWGKDLQTDQYLIGDELTISRKQIEEHHLSLEKEVLYPDLTVAFRIVRTNPQYQAEIMRK